MKPPPWAVIPAVSITLPEPYDDRSGGATGRGLAIGDGVVPSAGLAEVQIGPGALHVKAQACVAHMAAKRALRDIGAVVRQNRYHQRATGPALRLRLPVLGARVWQRSIRHALSWRCNQRKLAGPARWDIGPETEDPELVVAGLTNIPVERHGRLSTVWRDSDSNIAQERAFLTTPSATEANWD